MAEMQKNQLGLKDAKALELMFRHSGTDLAVIKVQTIDDGGISMEPLARNR